MWKVCEIPKMFSQPCSIVLFGVPAAYAQIFTCFHLLQFELHTVYVQLVGLAQTSTLGPTCIMYWQVFHRLTVFHCNGTVCAKFAIWNYLLEVSYNRLKLKNRHFFYESMFQLITTQEAPMFTWEALENHSITTPKAQCSVVVGSAGCRSRARGVLSPGHWSVMESCPPGETYPGRQPLKEGH